MNTRPTVIVAASMVVLCVAAGLFPVLVVPAELAQVERVVAQTEQTYYGYVPYKIWRNETQPSPQTQNYWINPATMLDHAVVGIVGAQDATSVKIYTLPDRNLVNSFTVNRMESVMTDLRNGTFFKVVTSKPASVLLLGGFRLEAPSPDGSFSSFLPSVDGGYVGKEFVFLNVHSTTPARSIEAYGVSLLPGLPYIVFALEDSTVTMFDENGNQVAQYELKANKYKDFALAPYKAYRLQSTGNIMVETFVIEKPCFIPAAKGTFVGSIFYAAGSVPESGNVANPLRFFLFSSTEGARLSICDLDYARESKGVTIPAGENVSLRVTDNQYMAVESDKPILIAYRSQPSEGGIAVVGLATGQTADIFVFGQGYIFAYTDTVVNVDDVTLRLAPDGIQPITEGLHRISTDKNIVIETVHIDPMQGFNDFGQYLPSAQSISIRYEGLSLKPVVEQTPWLYYGAGAAVAVVVVVLVVWSVKRRKP